MTDGFVLAQVALQKVIQAGLEELKQDRSAFNTIFRYYTDSPISADYGTEYVSNIWSWFSTKRIPVVQAWGFNTARVPSVSLHLAMEQEDESKAAVGDHFGVSEDDYDVSTGVFNVNVDIGLHTSKEGDEVLWMYYIINYILFKQKRLAEALGLRLQTFSASDYNKESKYMADNIWTRWLRYRCTVENTWDDQAHVEFDDVALDLDVQSNLETGDDNIQDHTRTTIGD